MIDRKLLKTLFLLLPGLILITGFSSEAADQSRTREEWEAFLRTAEIVSAEPDENAGRSEPWRVSLRDAEGERRAIFKHVDRIRPHPIPDSYRYELAAYRLDTLLGIRIIPPTVERVIKGVRGSLSLYLEGCRSLKEIHGSGLELSRQDVFFRSMRDIQVFENLTACGHSDEDVLVNPKTGKICRVDFSQAFHPGQQASTGQEVRECSEFLLENLKNLTDDKIREGLTAYLNMEEIDALIIRRGRIIELLGK